MRHSVFLIVLFVFFIPALASAATFTVTSNADSGPGTLREALTKAAVFTRYGEKIFESKGYNKPFDGTTNGRQLPAGVYYYIINLNTDCNLLSGS